MIETERVMSYSYFNGKSVTKLPVKTLRKRLLNKVKESGMTFPSYSYYDGITEKRCPDANALYQNLLSNVREVFEVKRFEEGGLTEMETIELLHHFLIFMGNKK